MTNCIAFSNTAHGFTDNSQTGTFTLSRNTAWKNGGTGFVFKTSVTTLTENIAASNVGAQYSLSSAQKASGNSWNIGGTWNDASFKSVNPATMQGARATSGKIVGSDFLLPTSGAAIGATTYW